MVDLHKDKNKTLYDVDDILLDSEFNHRGKIRIIEIASLAKDIRNKGGLVQPIAIRPIDHEKYSYQVVDGHRRLTAYKHLGAKQIPAVIDTLNEFEARTHSAVANLQKQDLNIMQEANAIKHLWAANYGRSAIASEVGMSPGWVQVRTMLLSMPEGVKVTAAKGSLTGDDIKHIDKLPRAEQEEAAYEIHRQRQNGQRITLKQKQKRSTKKARKPYEIYDMMETVREIMLQIETDVEACSSDLINIDGDNFATSFAAWCAGYINNYDFHKRIQKYCELFGHTYIIPVFD